MTEMFLVPREPTYEDVKRVAIALCRADGHDPFGPTCDIYIEDDPDAGKPWAGYRKKSRSAWSAMIAAAPSSPVGEGVREKVAEVISRNVRGYSFHGISDEEMAEEATAITDAILALLSPGDAG